MKYYSAIVFVCTFSCNNNRHFQFINIDEGCNMAAVPFPNNTKDSACMSNAEGCRFFNGHHQVEGQCPNGAICCIFSCDDPECHD